VLHALLLQHLGELLADRRRRQAFEIELQAARQYGHQQLLWIGGGEDELDVRWRLFQRLQQRVECAL
jgi:2'-5' RNA ligase